MEGCSRELLLCMMLCLFSIFHHDNQAIDAHIVILHYLTSIYRKLDGNKISGSPKDSTVTSQTSEDLNLRRYSI